MTTAIHSKAVVLGMLFKVDVANPNAGWTEENVTTLKKIETPDNRQHPYISGQALRRYLRDTIEENVEMDTSGKPLYSFSPEEPGPDPKSPILTEGRPDLYIDDDLFGFMRAVRGGTRRRESPLRVSAAFGLFPYTGDRDLGTRSALQVTHDPERGGAVFETEVTNNVFRTTWLLELDRVGYWLGYENAENQQQWAAESTGAVQLAQNQTGHWGKRADPERKTRVKAVLKAIKYLEGGARQARLLIELVPQMVIYARCTRKVAMFLNSLQVTPANGHYDLVEGPLMEVLKDYADDIQALFIGLRDGFVSHSKAELLGQVKMALGNRVATINPEVVSIGEAVDKMVMDIGVASF
jgi:CRISPR-associated protein Cst2